MFSPQIVTFNRKKPLNTCQIATHMSKVKIKDANFILPNGNPYLK